MNLNKISYKLKRLFDYLGYILFFPISIIIVLYLIFFNPKIKYFCIKSTRLGHLVAEVTILYLLQKNNVKFFNNKIIFYCRPISCNNFLIKLFKKKITIFPHFLMHSLHYVLIFFEERLKIYKLRKYYISSDEIGNDRDVNYLIYKNKEIFKIDSSDTLKAKQILENKFGYKGQKIVCVFNRDSKYLKQNFINDFSYHDFRNLDGNLLIKSIKYLLDKGYFVFRMGQEAETKLKLKHDNFVDYPFSKYKSDFLDVLLFKMSFFSVGSDCGLNSISNFIFKKPHLSLISPIGVAFTFFNNNYTIAPRRLFYKNSSIELNFDEICKNDLIFALNQNDYNKLNVEYRDSANEIRDYVVEFEKKLTSNWIIEDKERKLKEKFWIKLYQYFRNQSKVKEIEKIHNLYKKPLSQISYTFLKKNEKWL